MEHHNQPQQTTGSGHPEQDEPAWTREQEKKLLRLFAPHACLYDTYMAVYFTFEERERKYVEICEKLQQFRPAVTVDEIKMKIKHFRRQFNRERRLIKQAEQDNVVYVPDLWCFESLKNIFHSRPSSSSENSSVVVISDESGRSKSSASRTQQDDSKENPTTSKPEHHTAIQTPLVKTQSRRKRRRSDIFEEDPPVDQPTIKSKRSSDHEDSSQSNDSEKLNYHGDTEIETIGSIPPPPARYYRDEQQQLQQLNASQETLNDSTGPFIGVGPLSDFDESTMWLRSEEERQEYVLRKMHLRDFLKVVNEIWNAAGKNSNYYKQYFIYDLDSLADAPVRETLDSDPLRNTYYLFPDEVAGIPVTESSDSHADRADIETKPSAPVDSHLAENWMHMQPSTSRQAMIGTEQKMDTTNAPVEGPSSRHAEIGNRSESSSRTDSCEEKDVILPSQEKDKTDQKSPGTFFDLKGARPHPPLDIQSIAELGLNRQNHNPTVDSQLITQLSLNRRKPRKDKGTKHKRIKKSPERPASGPPNDLWMLVKACEIIERSSASKSSERFSEISGEEISVPKTSQTSSESSVEKLPAPKRSQISIDTTSQYLPKQREPQKSAESSGAQFSSLKPKQRFTEAQLKKVCEPKPSQTSLESSVEKLSVPKHSQKLPQSSIETILAPSQRKPQRSAESSIESLPALKPGHRLPQAPIGKLSTPKLSQKPLDTSLEKLSSAKPSQNIPATPIEKSSAPMTNEKPAETLTEKFVATEPSPKSPDNPMDLSAKSSDNSEFCVNITFSNFNAANCDSGQESGSNYSHPSTPEISSKINSNYNRVPAYVDQSQYTNNFPTNTGNMAQPQQSYAPNHQFYMQQSVHQTGIAPSNPITKKLNWNTANLNNSNSASAYCGSLLANLPVNNSNQYQMSNSNVWTGNGNNPYWQGMTNNYGQNAAMNCQNWQQTAMNPGNQTFGNYQAAYPANNVQPQQQQFYYPANVNMASEKMYAQGMQQQQFYPYSAQADLLASSREMQQYRGLR